MKLKASPRGQKVVVELGRGESGFPPISVPELALKRILVPVDFSDLSEKSLHYAVSFARQFNSEIYLLHVVEIIPTPEVVVAESASLNAKLRQQAEEQLSGWRKGTGIPSVFSRIEDGIPYREIVRMADEINAELIILGTQGRRGLSRLFVGSTAERVVRHAPCPVMVVRERAHDFFKEENATTKKESRKLRQRKRVAKE